MSAARMSREEWKRHYRRMTRVSLLVPAALFARIAREGLLAGIALWGALMWLSVGTLGAAVHHFRA
ncbi:hypothetical protein [Streptomyces sp. NBC_00102]|uniref:hypothetical protein n=1 Tax=Streptomyces sp. NBC_00102 TaxID=2975652 RepID=UPI0022592130|nr:hypothetical protein [Streptomyces sp. NBC_00102]MCX5399725.1 hypothetical protein [Streptomyces sp. NBC_00102]